MTPISARFFISSGYCQMKIGTCILHVSRPTIVLAPAVVTALDGMRRATFLGWTHSRGITVLQFNDRRSFIA
jgi:hypothetical protein